MSGKNALMLAGALEAARKGREVAILCLEGVVRMKLENTTKACADVDWLEEWRKHNPPIDEEVPSQFFTGKHPLLSGAEGTGRRECDREGNEIELGSDKPDEIDTDYLLQIRDRNKDRVIRELAGKLHEIIRRVHEIEEDYLK